MEATRVQQAGQQPLTVERHGAVVTLWLNRPEALNALDIELACALRDAARTLAGDATVRAVVLRGAGKGFSAGGDLGSLRQGADLAAQALLDAVTEAVDLLTTMDAPLVAAVHGVAAGGGMSLMLHADFIVAAEGTRFALAYDKIGASCDVGASWMLPRLVGLRRALEIALLGDRLDADAALKMGLVNKVVPADALDHEVDALAQRLAQGPTLAFGRMRRLLRSSFQNDLATQMAAETVEFVQGTQTEDFRAGVESFFARQAPVFTGR